jgi:hypothetical protein
LTTPLADAVSVTDWAEVTDDTVAAKDPVGAPAGTVTEEGTVTALLLLDRLTANPPLPAAALRVSVQGSPPPPVIELRLHDTELSPGLAEPVELLDPPSPFNLIFSEGLAKELLEMVSCPVESPVAFGSKCTAVLYVPPLAATEIGRLFGFVTVK